MTRSLRRPGLRAVVAGSLALAALTSGSLAARQVLRFQAALARKTIGKDLGEEAHRADRTYKSKYGDRIELLVLGDSIAAGLGAETPRQTLGAHLAKRLAKQTRRAVRLHTAAIVGAETSMLRAQLAGLPTGYRPDVAVIVGGNDVTHRIRFSTSVAHLVEAVEALQAGGCQVVVGTCPDLSALPSVPQPLRALAGRSSRQLAEAQRAAVTGLGARAVALAQVAGPFFLAQPDEMFAIDRFHPSGAGYRRTAKALLPSVLMAAGHGTTLPSGHFGPTAVG
ncbi:SGNH/GDSL hydrolase family protein [Nocardioides pelophilus]|uniref:SGNH/GDSL hydrolase family protein n=1 Tax=Nocardioides pelophilus TaxID=2172019 RepID=UPI001601C469|nr:SGNH/GDSL hydrolase family protein [Nocardioides pelophilus]